MLFEVRALGGRNESDAYRDASRWEYNWSELVVPYVLDPVSQAWTNKSHMITGRLIKRQSADLIVIQHLDISLFPLTVRVTSDVIHLMHTFFSSSHNSFTSKEDKYKSKFLPHANQTMINDQQSDATYDPNNAHKLFGSANKHRPHSYSQSVVQAIKHKRYISVAKELYRKARGIDENSINSASNSADPSPAHSRNPSTMAGVTSPTGPTQLSDASHIDTMDDNPSRASLAEYDRMIPIDSFDDAIFDDSVTRQRRKAIARRQRRTLVKSVEPNIMFMYVRFNRSSLLLSFRGNKEHNIENFEGVCIKIRQFVIQRKLLPFSKFISKIRNEYIKIVLGQLGSGVRDFLAYKLGIRTAEQRKAERLARLAGSGSTKSFEVQSSTTDLYGELADDTTDDQPNSPTSDISIEGYHTICTPSNMNRPIRSNTIDTASENKSTKNALVQGVSMLFGRKNTSKRMTGPLSPANSTTLNIPSPQSLSNNNQSTSFSPIKSHSLAPPIPSRMSKKPLIQTNRLMSTNGSELTPTREEDDDKLENPMDPHLFHMLSNSTQHHE